DAALPGVRLGATGVAARNRDETDGRGSLPPPPPPCVDGPRGEEAPLARAVYPQDGSVTGRKAVSRMRWFRGRVRTNRTTSATSSEDILPSDSGTPGVRHR